MASALSLLEIEIEIIENSLRCQRVFRDRLNPMEAYSDFDFIARYRITKYMFVNLLNKISISFPLNCSNNTTSCSSAVLSYWNVSDSYRIRTWNLANVCIEMRNCCDKSVNQHSSSIYQISEYNSTKGHSRIFLKKYKFPLVLGCIDGSHVPILVPSTNEDIYVNRLYS